MLRSWRRLRASAPIAQYLQFPGYSRKLSVMGSRHSVNSPHPLPDSPTAQYDDLYKYTGGRWLNRDELERNARYLKFDFPALCDRAVSLLPEAKEIVKVVKTEGGSSKVFLFTMDSGSCVVARLPTCISGPPRLTTNSEVATMAYLQSKLSLPIPRVLDWSDDPSNPIGAEYIIQEHVVGVQLHQKWPEMNTQQHMLSTKALSLTLKKMATLDFPAYGSLYFSNAPLDSHVKTPLKEGYCIGPHCNPGFWNQSTGEHKLYSSPSPNCGPWKDLASYCAGLIETGFARLPKQESFVHKILPHQGSIKDHISLSKINQEVMQKLIENKQIQNAATPIMFHPDFHKRNIYVSAEEPTTITGLIDWQSTSIEPAFIYANDTPDFAALPEETEDMLGTKEQEIAADPKKHEREQRDLMICHQTYDVVMTGLIPKMRPAKLLDPTLFRLFHYCHMSWRDSAAAVRQELIDLTAQWTELGFQGQCPFSMTEEELEKHAKQYEDFEGIQKLKSFLKETLHTNSEGWVPNDAWDSARDAHRAIYDQWMETARYSDEESFSIEKADKMWPFDAR